MYLSLTSFLQECICVKLPGQEFHNCKCLFGEYLEYRVEKILHICPLEEDGDTFMRWRCYEKHVVGRNEIIGQPKKRIQKAFKEIEVSHFVSYLRPNL